MFANDDLDVDAEVIFISDNFSDSSARLLCRRRPVGDLNIHHNSVEIAPIAATGGFVA